MGNKVFDEMVDMLRQGTVKFADKEAFFDYVYELANKAWQRGQDERMAKLYETYENSNPAIMDKDMARAKVEEIKSRKAGSWEPYMVLKEVIGVDLVNPPDIDGTQQSMYEELDNQISNIRKNVDWNKKKGSFRRSE